MSDHEAETIAAGARYLVGRLQERGRLLRALLSAIDQRESVIALIYASESADAAGRQLMTLLGIDQEQARVVLDMQARKLAGLERQALADEYRQVDADMSEYESIAASPERQREVAGTQRGEFLAQYARQPGLQGSRNDGSWNSGCSGGRQE